MGTTTSGPQTDTAKSIMMVFNDQQFGSRKDQEMAITMDHPVLLKEQLVSYDLSSYCQFAGCSTLTTMTPPPHVLVL